MDPTPDELAGVVDLFGALTRAELCEGVAELAFKRGEEYDPDAFDGNIDDALRSYHLVAVETDAGESLLVVGPAAFPELPDGATDLPHILDVPERDPDHETAGTAAARRFRQDAATAIDDGDTDRIRALFDVSYELEAWGGVDLAGVRDRLD